MGIASFLGNLPWDRIADIAEGAAEIHRPGGSLANLERNRLAQKLLQQQMEENKIALGEKQSQRAGLSKLAELEGAPKINPVDFVPQFPQTADDLINAPRVKSAGGTPVGLLDPALDVARGIDNPDFKNAVLKQKTDTNAAMMQAYPELRKALVLKSMTPEYQKVGNTLGVIEDGEFNPIFTDTTRDSLSAADQRRFDLMENRGNQQHREAMARFGAVDAREAARLEKERKDQERRDRPVKSAYVSNLTGNPLMYNPVDGNHYDGPNTVAVEHIVPAASFEKEVGAAKGLVNDIRMAEKTLEKVKSNPSAFDLVKVKQSQILEQAPMFGKQLANTPFTEDERKVRADIQRDAAMIVNKLYGAAVSTGELARAATFLATPDDTLETIMPKLQSALDWANEQTGSISPGAVSRAKSLLGVKPDKPGPIDEDEYLNGGAR
jgi:hypothetical protein